MPMTAERPDTVWSLQFEPTTHGSLVVIGPASSVPEMQLVARPADDHHPAKTDAVDLSAFYRRLAEEFDQEQTVEDFGGGLIGEIIPI